MTYTDVEYTRRRGGQRRGDMSSTRARHGVTQELARLQQAGTTGSEQQKAALASAWSRYIEQVVDDYLSESLNETLFPSLGGRSSED